MKAAYNKAFKAMANSHALILSGTKEVILPGKETAMRKSGIIVTVITLTIFFMTMILHAEEYRVFRLASDGQKIMPADGSPYMIAAFNPDGTVPAGVYADFRLTKFDISAVAKKLRNEIGIAAQQSTSGEFTHVIVVDGTNLDSFSIDKNYLVFPTDKQSIDKGGPFVTLVFHRKASTSGGDPVPLNGWAIQVTHKGQSFRGQLTKSGAFDIGQAGLEPIRCTITDPFTSASYDYVAYPAVRGARAGLVRYLIWDSTNSARKVSGRDRTN